MCEEEILERRMDDEMFDGYNESNDASWMRDDAMSFMVAFSLDDVLMYEKNLGDHFLSNTFSSLQYAANFPVLCLSLSE